MICKVKMQFDPQVAKDVGVEEAMMLSNIDYWCEKNKANEKHFYDGHYWTYNSVEAFSRLFPFWTQKQIVRILKNLEDKKYLLSGYYNKSKYDRTKWYCCVCQNGQMENLERSNDNMKLQIINTNDKQLPPIAPQGGAVEITDQTNEDSQPRKEVETSNQSLDGNSSLVGVALVEPAALPETGVADLSTNHQLEENKKTGKAVNDLLAVFYKKNPHIPFGKPSERRAAEDIIKIHGIEDAIKIAEYAVSLNSTPYAPVINSATQLKVKLPALKAYYDRTRAIEAQKEERAKLIFGSSYEEVKKVFKLMEQK